MAKSRVKRAYGEENERNLRDLRINFKSQTQEEAWGDMERSVVTFLLGPAGCGKTFIAMAYAIKKLLHREKKRIVLTRPIVEAGESLGYLPGDFYEKVNPYMLPLFDAMTKLLGANYHQKQEYEDFTTSYIRESVEIAPLAFMRGRSFDDSICIFDEAQNATIAQIKLFLSRFTDNSQLIITGDPMQSDLFKSGGLPLIEVVNKLEGIPGISVVRFDRNSIVRHPLIASILEKLED